MTKDRATVLGRDAERDQLDDVVVHTSGALVVLRGAAGVGKTALLDAACAGWRRREVRVVHVTADEPGQPFLDAVLGAVREQWDQYCDPSLFGLVRSAVRSYQNGAAGPATMTVVYELTRVLGQLARSRRTVLVLDGIDLTGAHDAGELSLFCRGAVGCGAVVLVALREQQPGAEPLLSAADTVLDLAPLPEQDIQTLLARRSGGRLPLDPAAVDALRAGLGEWFGNPGTVLGCVAGLAESGRLMPADGHLCLTGPEEIALPDGHPLLAGAGSLAAGVAELDGLRVDDLPLLAAATGTPVDDCGRGLDQLVRQGTLRLTPEGTAHPAVPALGAALRARLPVAQRRELHAAFADAQLARARRNVGIDLPALARHVLHAGSPRFRPAATDLLLAEAERITVDDPNTAADCRRGALRSAAATGEHWPELARSVLRALLCRHRFAELTEDIAGVVAPGLSTMDTNAADTVAVLATETVVCGMTALLFTSPSAVHPEVFASLIERSGHVPALTSFCEAVLARRLDVAAGELLPVAVELAERTSDDWLVRICQVLRMLSAVSGDDTAFRAALSAWRETQPDHATGLDVERLRTAASVLDDATVLELVLGVDPERRADGPAQVYRDVLAAYHDGDWDAALSRARSLLHAPGGHPVYTLVRAFAAEICTSRGELDRARDWLSGLNPAVPGGHLIGWAHCALLWHSGRGAEAVHAGWQQYRAHPGWVGADRLLLRVARYAKHLGHTEDLAAAVAELHVVHEAVRTQHSTIAVHLADGLCHDDPVALRTGLDLARKHGPVGAVLGACLELAGVADEPQPLLHEAYGLARRVSSTVLRTQLSTVMRERGVPLPRSRARRAELRTVERRIVELVSDGCTNRQIAASLAMSEKSVESHLTRLFTRTGYRSRVQLTAALLNGSLLEDPVPDDARGETTKAAR